MKTAEVIEKLGGKKSLLATLGITRQALAQWGDDVPILREYELRQRFPKLFDANEKP